METLTLTNLKKEPQTSLILLFHLFTVHLHRTVSVSWQQYTRVYYPLNIIQRYLRVLLQSRGVKNDSMQLDLISIYK